MNGKILKALYRKEMLDILRDKKTILMMIVVPLILYPLIFMLSMYMASSMLTASTSKSYRVSVQEVAEPQEMEIFLLETEKEHDYDFIIVDSYTEHRDSETALREGEIDAYLIQSVSENKPYYEIAYLASETDSQTAAGMLQDMMKDYRDKMRRELLEEQGLDSEQILSPVGYAYKDLSSNEENAGNLLGYMIPFLMITSILMGAMYPAIDTTAGEKERGTLETMLTMPVRNLELITAKFLATSTVAVAAAFLNLLSMGLLGAYTYSSMQYAGSAGGLNVFSYLPAILIMLLCVIVFAMFASGACLSACIFARSFKEAQNYTSPVMIIFMLGGMAGMIPSLRLNETTALIPVVNITLLISELFKLHFDLSLIAMVLFSNIAYAGVTIVLMTRFFSSENILFGDAAVSLKLMEARKDMKAKQIPGVGDVILLFSVLLLVILFAGSLAVVRLGICGLLVEQGLLFAVTAFYAWYIRTDAVKVFHLRRPRVFSVIAAVLCWAGGYLLIQVLANGLMGLFPDLSQENTQMLVGLWEGVPLWLLVLAVAVFPAVCEETVFRGFLLGALEHKYSAPAAVIVTGLLFGLYHMSLLQFVLIGLLGILFSYVAWKEQCIWLSILMHFLNNLTSLLLQQFEEPITKRIPALAGEMNGSTVFFVLLAGAVLLAAGLFLLQFRGKRGELK